MVRAPAIGSGVVLDSSVLHAVGTLEVGVLSRTFCLATRRLCLALLAASRCSCLVVGAGCSFVLVSVCGACGVAVVVGFGDTVEEYYSNNNSVSGGMTLC